MLTHLISELKQNKYPKIVYITFDVGKFNFIIVVTSMQNP